MQIDSICSPFKCNKDELCEKHSILDKFFKLINSEGAVYLSKIASDANGIKQLPIVVKISEDINEASLISNQENNDYGFSKYQSNYVSNQVGSKQYKLEKEDLLDVIEEILEFSSQIFEK